MFDSLDGRCLKFLVTESGKITVARVLAGPEYESMKYAGTVTMPTALFNKFLDALTFGAATQPDLQVYFAPDEEMRVG